VARCGEESPSDCFTSIVQPRNLLHGSGPVLVRLICAFVAGAGAAGACGIAGAWWASPAAGWDAAAAVYLVWTWLVIATMDAEQTASHATREDPTRALTDLVMLLASVASLGGVAYVLSAGKSHGSSAVLTAALGVTTVVAAWLTVHTVFSLRYALLYYDGKDGGVDFNQRERPSYVDFAYLSFTLGMTYQVSDTDLQTRAIRTTALRQALLSYVFGAVILATTINLIAGLGSSGH
jgi:uncharacterized membrane protein